MKTGIEIIAKRRNNIQESRGRLGHVSRMLLRADMVIEFSSRPSHDAEAIQLLTEAGAIIAAEIDRLNDKKQE